MLRRNLLAQAVILALAAWLAFWLTSGRYAMLDDCFIHLRYADFLLRTHTITYDGVHRSFGTSSPLYVIVLALLRPVFSGPLLPKGLSVSLYLILMSVLVARCFKENDSPIARVLLLMLTFCLASPMGIRWLTDGMETPFQILFAVLLALIADRETRRDSLSPLQAGGLVFFGFLMTTLRLESASLLFLVSLAIFASRLTRPSSSKMTSALRSTPLAFGAILALVTIRLTLGSFLPDTALAKTGSPSLKPLLESVHLLLSSLTLGIGVFALWLLSMALVMRAITSTRALSPRLPVIALANAILPLTLTLACLRGQFVQGIRYLLWCMVFSTLWNILQIGRLALMPLSRQNLDISRSALPQPGTALAFTGVLLLVMLPLEVHFVRPTLKGRGATFTELRSTPLSLLRDDRIMSADVGYLGYFSGATICDVEGLVDGRAFASKTKPDRIRACATGSPDVLFLNDFQLAEASVFTDLGQWSVCRTYDYAGVTVSDRHYLMVPSVVAPGKCPALGGQPSPYRLAASIPALSPLTPD